jgi:hypothetical protein
MAIDTADKRMAMLGFGSGDVLLTPDGSISSFDWYSLLGLYGIADVEIDPVPGLAFSQPRDRLDFSL